MFPKLNKSLAIALKQMKENAVEFPSTKIKGELVLELIEREILHRKIKGKGFVYAINPGLLDNFLQHELKISSLDEYILALENPGDRAQNVKVSGDSKITQSTIGEGFLVNSIYKISCSLNNQEFIIDPCNGVSYFIHDIDYFKVPEDIVIVGFENFENFRKISLAGKYFANGSYLFVSRYLNKSKSFQKWLATNNNPYIHFGDFDLAGIHIYLKEIKVHVNGPCSFFIPENIEQLFMEFGNRQRFIDQANRYNHDDFLYHPEVSELYKLILKYKAGVDQEILLANI